MVRLHRLMSFCCRSCTRYVHLQRKLREEMVRLRRLMRFRCRSCTPYMYRCTFSTSAINEFSLKKLHSIRVSMYFFHVRVTCCLLLQRRQEKQSHTALKPFAVNMCVVADSYYKFGLGRYTVSTVFYEILLIEKGVFLFAG